jgi:hypothetical protein
LPIFVSPRLTFTFCIMAPFFLSELNGMATDINSMTPRGIGHELRIAIWDKRLRKTWGTPWIF